MKILKLMVGHQLWSEGPVVSGEVKNTCTAATLLRRKGHDVIVISGPAIWQRRPSGEVKSNIIYTKPGISKGIVYYLTRAIFMISAIKKQVTIREIDIIHCHSPIQAIAAKIATAAINRNTVPVIITAHGSYLPELKADLVNAKNLWQHLRVINSKAQAIVDMFAYKLADKVIVTSEFQKKEMIESYKVPLKKITRIYNPCSVYFDKKIYPSQSNGYILFVGRFVRKKGLRFLIELFARISKDYTGKLEIVGGGMVDEKLMHEVEADIDRFKLRGKVTIKHELSEIALAKAYRDCDVLLIPSEGYESIPTVVIEGVKAGAQVLATDNWGIPEILKNDLNKASEKDLVQWEKKLRILLDPQVTKRDLRGDIHDDFKNDVIVKQHEELYRGLLESHG